MINSKALEIVLPFNFLSWRPLKKREDLILEIALEDTIVEIASLASSLYSSLIRLMAFSLISSFKEISDFS